MVALPLERIAVNDTLPNRVLEGFEMFSMANLRTRSTGIPDVTLYCSQGEFEGKSSVHGPRVKVYLGSRLTREMLRDPIIIKLTDPPQVVVGSLTGKPRQLVMQFLSLNREVLIQYWNDLNMDLEELLERLEKV